MTTELEQVIGQLEWKRTSDDLAQRYRDSLALIDQIEPLAIRLAELGGDQSLADIVAILGDNRDRFNDELQRLQDEQSLFERIGEPESDFFLTSDRRRLSLKRFTVVK